MNNGIFSEEYRMNNGIFSEEYRMNNGIFSEEYRMNNGIFSEEQRNCLEYRIAERFYSGRAVWLFPNPTAQAKPPQPHTPLIQAVARAGKTASNAPAPLANRQFGKMPYGTLRQAARLAQFCPTSQPPQRNKPPHFVRGSRADTARILSCVASPPCRRSSRAVALDCPPTTLWWLGFSFLFFGFGFVS